MSIWFREWLTCRCLLNVFICTCYVSCLLTLGSLYGNLFWMRALRYSESLRSTCLILWLLVLKVLHSNTHHSIIHSKRFCINWMYVLCCKKGQLDVFSYKIILVFLQTGPSSSGKSKLLTIRLMLSLLKNEFFLTPYPQNR